METTPLLSTAPIKARSVSAGISPSAIKARSVSAGISPSAIKARSVSAGISAAPMKTRIAITGIPAVSRRAFTLVELLVVIGIIALLAAIVTPAVMRAQASARNAAIKAEIDMLHMAMMNYKNEYGSFPPCVPGATNRDVLHLKRLFPRIDTATAQFQLQIASAGTSGGTTDSTCKFNILNLTPKTALTFWLFGYTSSPTSPLYPGNERVKLFDFDSSRMTQASGKYTGEYYASGKPGAQYSYMLSSTPTADLASFIPLERDSNGNVFNENTFQIVSPGRNEIFGDDDDLSNFWPGTRKDYADSLTK